MASQRVNALHLPLLSMHAHQVDRRRHKLLTSGIHISDCNCRGLSLDRSMAGDERGTDGRRKWELCTERDREGEGGSERAL